MKFTPLLGALALCFITHAAFAQDVGAPPAPGAEGRPPMEDRMKHKLAEIDTNHDGKIDRSEFMAQCGAHFDKMDTNHDGFITPDERKAARENHKMREGGGGGAGFGGPAPGGAPGGAKVP